MTDPFDDDEELAPARAPREPRSRRDLALVGVRVAAGVGAVAVAAALIAASSLLPLPAVTATAPRVEVTPQPVEQRLVCPGAVLQQGVATDGPAVAAAAGPLVVETADAAVADELAPLDDAPIGSAELLTAPPDADAAPLSAAQSQSVAQEEFAGFTASTCSAPSSDSWLIGGATTVGRTTLVTIANPSEVTATVDVSVFGEQGRVPVPGAEGLALPAGTRTVLPLAGLAPDLVAPVIRVTSRGGQVVAALQQSVVRGIEPGGLDITGAAASPGERLVVPAVVIADAGATRARLAEAGFEDLESTLRVLAGGDEPTTAVVSVTPLSGAGVGTSFELELRPGVVVEQALDLFDDGVYSVTVTADVPLVGAVRSSQTALDGSSTDFAWSAAAPALDDLAGASIAPGPAPRLVLVNPSGTDREATIAGEPVAVPAGGAVIRPVDAGTLALEGVEGLHATIAYSGAAASAAYPVLARPLAAEPVTVYPR